MEQYRQLSGHRNYRSFLGIFSSSLRKLPSPSPQITVFSKMTDEELVRFGKAAREVCSASANRGKPPREVFVIQLREAKEEWMRRHPANTKTTSQ